MSFSWPSLPFEQERSNITFFNISELVVGHNQGHNRAEGPQPKSLNRAEGPQPWKATTELKSTTKNTNELKGHNRAEGPQPRPQPSWRPQPRPQPSWRVTTKAKTELKGHNRAVGPQPRPQPSWRATTGLKGHNQGHNQGHNRGEVSQPGLRCGPVALYKKVLLFLCIQCNN